MESVVLLKGVMYWKRLGTTALDDTNLIHAMDDDLYDKKNKIND